MDSSNSPCPIAKLQEQDWSLSILFSWIHMCGELVTHLCRMTQELTLEAGLPSMACFCPSELVVSKYRLWTPFCYLQEIKTSRGVATSPSGRPINRYTQMHPVQPYRNTGLWTRIDFIVESISMVSRKNVVGPLANHHCSLYQFLALSDVFLFINLAYLGLSLLIQTVFWL